MSSPSSLWLDAHGEERPEPNTSKLVGAVGSSETEAWRLGTLSTGRSKGVLSIECRPTDSAVNGGGGGRRPPADVARTRDVASEDATWPWDCLPAMRYKFCMPAAEKRLAETPADVVE